MGLDHGFEFLKEGHVCEQQSDIETMYSCHRREHVMDRIVKESYFYRDNTTTLPDYINVDLELCRLILTRCNKLFTMYINDEIEAIMKEPYWIDETSLKTDMLEVATLLYEVTELMTKHHDKLMDGKIIYFYTNH